MTDLYVVCEGQTEEAFVKRVLAPHLRLRHVEAIPIVVTTSRDATTGEKHQGGGRWKHWNRDLTLVMKQHGRRARVAFTTFFDLYGLPPDFPRLEAHSADGDTARRAGALELELAKVFDEHRLIPYLQRHEFEALVLACLDDLEGWLDAGDRAGVATLRAELGSAMPEDVNDGPQTAPSKRLIRCIPGFRKTVHGVDACELAGLAKLRARCPRFDAWVAKLEALGEVSP